MVTKVMHKEDLPVEQYKQIIKGFEEVRDAIRALWKNYQKFHLQGYEAWEKPRKEFMKIAAAVFADPERYSQIPLCYPFRFGIKNGPLTVGLTYDSERIGIRLESIVYYQTGDDPNDYIMFMDLPNALDYFTIETN